MLGACIAQLVVSGQRHGDGFSGAMGRDRVVFALVIYAVLALPYPLALLVYHCFLTGRGETTRELLNGRKFVEAERHRPFSLGSAWKNWVGVLARPRPPSYVGLKRGYVSGDQRLGSRRGGEGEMEMRKLGEMEEGVV